jgi:VWFA-related protein
MGQTLHRGRAGAGRAFLAALSLAAALTVPGAARSSRQDRIPDQKPLRHEVTVALKLIHVYVTDRNGRPVHGLTKGDFVLRDDGVVREVTDFEEHVPAESSAEARLAERPLKEPRLPGRKLLFFFDFGFNTGRGIQRSAKIAMDFLDKRLGPRDQVAVATFSGLKGLQVPLLFTSDIQAVRGLVGRIGAFEQSGRIEELEDRYQQNLKDGAYADARPEGVLTWNVPIATGFNPEAEQRHLIRMYLDNLLALARALRYEPGQKSLVFFSDGAPYRSIWRGDQMAVDAKGNSPSQFAEIRNLAEELLKELASSNVTVFALNTSEPDARPELLRGGTLGKMAQATGGSYWGNSYVAEAFSERIQSQTGSYYVLGYPVDERWDGRYRRIKVDVARPGLSARTLAGYLNPKLFVAYSEEEKRIHLVDLALAGAPLSQAPLRFDLAAVPVVTAGKSGVRIAASIPWTEISDAIGSRTEITAMAFSALDEIVAERRLVIDRSRLSADAVPVVSDMPVPPGEYRCRLVVRNLETGRAAVARMTVEVPPPPAEGIRVLPPLLLRPERGPGGLKLDLSPPKPAFKAPRAEDAPDPLFDPAQYGPLPGGILRAGTEIGAEIHVLAGATTEPRARIVAVIIDRLTQERIPLAVTILARRDEPGASVLFVRLPIPDLEPDVYTLAIEAEDEESGAKFVIQRDVSIEITDSAARRGGIT